MHIRYLLTKLAYSPSYLGNYYRNIWKNLHLDGCLLTLLTLLIIIGLFILYSASNQQVNTMVSQGLHLAMAIIVMIIVAQIPPSALLRWTPWFYAVSLGLLIAVLIMGHIAKGAERWLTIGGFRFQPSELMKLAIPMMLAYYYQQKNLPPNWRDLAISVVIIAIPALLVAKQPDLGTTIVLVLSGGGILLFAGIRWRLIGGLLALILACLPVLWHFMHSYQRQRVLTFLSPERNPLGSGYHIIQSKIAIGSGGLLGKGWLQGTQSHLHFLPEHATDFIFAVSAEEFGLLGALIMIILYLLIASRGLYIASKAPDTFSRLLAATLSLTFFFSAFINIGMVSGILPVVGLPLPFISYSGTAMVTLLISFGIIMSIGGHKKLF